VDDTGVGQWRVTVLVSRPSAASRQMVRHRGRRAAPRTRRGPV